MTTISIAMATFNGERFLRQQLDSFASQILVPTELVVCDDCSTDSTVSIIDEFSRSAAFPVKIVNNSKRLGHTANFLQAAQYCRGDLIAFSDQDDEWFPNKLARILEASRESDALVFAHSTEWVDKDGNSTGIIFPAHPRYRKHIRMNDFPGHAMLFRRELLEMAPHSLSPKHYKEVAGDIEFGHDNLLLEIANAMDKVHFVADVLMRWRVYHSMTNQTWPDLLGPAPREKISFSERIFPPGLAERYAEAELLYRAHSTLLSSIVGELESSGKPIWNAGERLRLTSNLDAKRSEVMGQRARFYGSRSRRARVKLMLDGAAMGQYRRAKHGGVGPHNALRDVVAWILSI